MPALESSSRARRGGRRVPSASNRTWTSTWRAPSTSRSRMSRSSPNAAAASRRAAARRVGQARRVADDVHPLAAAAGRRLDQQRVADPSPRHPQGRVRLVRAVVAGQRPGRRAGRPGSRAAALSPIARIARGGGPTQRIPAASTASAKSAFSARNPKPGWTASAPAAGRPPTTASMSRRSTRAGAVGRGRDRRDPEPLAGAPDAAGDLAAVRDEHGRIGRRLADGSTAMGRRLPPAVAAGTPRP